MIKYNQFNLHKYFNFNDEIIQIVENILSRMEQKTDDEIYNAIDDEIIYTADEWSVIQYYFLPTDNNINLDDAIFCLSSDISKFLGGAENV